MSKGDKFSIDQLMAEGIEDLPNDVAFEKTSILIDSAGDQKRDDGLSTALEWCDRLQKRSLSAGQKALLEYFRANAWGNRQRIKHRDPEVAWNWEQPEVFQEVLSLRRALRLAEGDTLHSVRLCQIQTNLGNQLNTLGRFVDALPIWTRAIGINPQFGMALGNRGYGLYRYARSLYDPGHAYVFLALAHKDLSAALAPNAEYQGYHHKDARKLFARLKADIEKKIDIDKVRRSLRLNAYKIGRTKEEREYRQWVLYERLFLNPLNDLGPYKIAARDVFTLPDFRTSLNESPAPVGLFNQIKQEFVSARWMLYEGIHAHTMHFSDRQVLLYNTLDYPSYSLAIEKVKAAFRIVYSLFDKIAFFLNDYAKLGVPMNNVYFRTVWYVGQDAKKRVVRPELVQLQNLPLRGLYWLTKDFFDADIQDVMEPEAQALYVIRNSLEHRYLKVHEILVPRPKKESILDIWTDRLAYSVQRNDFEKKTLHLFKLARAAIIYLSLGMHREENRRGKGDPSKTAPMPLYRWPDRFKR
jgi:hypothetical protein